MMEERAKYQVNRQDSSINRLINIDIKSTDKFNTIKISFDTIDNTLKLEFDFNKKVSEII